jgi:predicted nuclease of predicted toxin-antitoxin system
MRFLIDMALSPGLSAWLVSEACDAVHVSHFGLDRTPDAEIMRFALAENRVLATADLDFPRLLAGLGAEGPGLILLRGGNYTEAQAIDCVRRVLAAVPRGRIASLDHRCGPGEDKKTPAASVSAPRPTSPPPASPQPAEAPPPARPRSGRRGGTPSPCAPPRAGRAGLSGSRAAG